MNRPCFVTAFLMRAIPSAVFGPVESPPCRRHRPFAIPGHWQGVPRLVFAAHRGAFEKSPGGFLFFIHPRRFSWGVVVIFMLICIPSVRVSHASAFGVTILTMTTPLEEFNALVKQGKIKEALAWIETEKRNSEYMPDTITTMKGNTLRFTRKGKPVELGNDGKWRLKTGR